MQADSSPRTVESIYTAFRFEPAAIGMAPMADPGQILESGPLPTVKTSLAATGTAALPKGTSTSTGTLVFAWWVFPVYSPGVMWLTCNFTEALVKVSSCFSQLVFS